MAKKNKNALYNDNYDSYDNSSSNDIDLIFNKIVEVNNSGNQQIYNLISDVEGKLSTQLNDIRNFLYTNRTPSNNQPNGSFWPNYTIMQPPMQMPMQMPVQMPIQQPIVDNSFVNSQMTNILNQFENLKRDINTNNNTIRNITSSNDNLDPQSIDTINNTCNKNAEQLYSAINYLENNIRNSSDEQANFNYNFSDSINALREEIYASQNSLLESIRINNNASSLDSNTLYDELTKVNDENTQNLFNYLASIETNLNENFNKESNEKMLDISNKLEYINESLHRESNENMLDINNKLEYINESLHRESNENMLDINNKLEYLNESLYRESNENRIDINNKLDYLNFDINQNTEMNNQNIHDRINDLENRIYESHEITNNNNYNLMDRVDESSMVYQDLLVNLRNELLDTNHNNFNEILNVATQLREELIESDNYTASNLLQHTNELQEESTNQLSFINEQIAHIKQMLYNLNEIIGISNDKFNYEIDSIRNTKNNDSSYQNELATIKELIKERNKVIEKAADKPPNENDIEDVPWENWEEEEDGEEQMENYKNNRRAVRIDESKLDMIYDRVEQINYEINNKLYELEMNIIGLINERDNEINYRTVESNKKMEKLVLDSIENFSSESEDNSKNLRKELLEKITDLKDEFFDKNKEMISSWDNSLKTSMDEMNNITSNIIEEMIFSQKKFDEMFHNVNSKIGYLEEQMMNISNDQMSIYDENTNKLEELNISIDKYKKEIKKTYLMWDENNDKIESLKENITSNSKEIQKLNISSDYKNVLESLKKIDEIKNTSEEFKNELTNIKSSNALIEEKLNSQKENIDEKINVLYNDFQSLIDSFDEKIQYDLGAISDDSKAHVDFKTNELSEKILDETSKKINILETQIDTSSNKLESKISEVNDEINDILVNLDNRIQKDTEDKLQMLYEETMQLISNVQLENELSKNEIEKTNKALFIKLDDSNQKIDELEELVSKSKDNRVDDLIEKINEMKFNNNNSAEKIKDIHESWMENNDKLKVLEDILKNQSLEMQNLSSMSQNAFDDSFDQIKILYDNESKIKEEIHQIQSNNSLLEDKLSKEKDLLESKIEDVTSNIDSMIVDLDTRVNEKTDNKMIKLYEETISMIDQLKEENRNSFKEISNMNEGVSLNLFEVNSKIAELEHMSQLDIESDYRFLPLFETINDIKNANIRSKEDVQNLIDSWKINNQKISDLENVLEKRSEEILFLTKNNEETFDDAYKKIEHLYESENLIKNEIININKINEDLEDKLLNEKNSLNERIKVLNQELEMKISTSEDKIISSTNAKFDELNTDLESKLIVLHNEVMNLIGELNESNQEITGRINLIENDTIKNFYSIEDKIRDIAELHSGISSEDPKYIEIKEMILGLKENNKEHSDRILNLQNNLNKNIKRSKSLKNILVAQSEEIQFIATSSQDAISTSFDRIHELFNSEKHIKQEIEKIYTENKLIQETIEQEKEILSTKLDNLNNDIDKKLVESEDKVNNKIADIHYELLEQITNIHYENISNIEKLTNLENTFLVEINENKTKIKGLDFLINQIPEEDPKFETIIRNIEELKEFSQISIDKMQENYEDINHNNEKIYELKNILDEQDLEISNLGQNAENAIVDIHDRVQELYESESNIKEEIEKIYLENNKINNIILDESKKNKKDISLKSYELKQMLKDFENKIEKDKVDIHEMIKDSETNILDETDKKIEDLKNDMSLKLEALYEETLSMISEINDGNKVLMDEISNLDSYTRITLMSIDSKISEIDFLVNQIPEEDPKFANFIEEINSLRQFNFDATNEIEKLHKSWILNNKKLGSLEEILLSQSEELRLLSVSNEEVWNLSFDRIQELYESESQIKEEIEKIFTNNNDIKSKFIEHKDILEEKVNAINNDLIGKISETREEVLTELDTKITDVNSTFESKINNLYSEITNIIGEVHSFNEINSSQILALKDEVNNFVIDINNKLFEINEEMNLLPEEDPKFHRLFSEVEQLRLDNDTSMYEIKKIYESWILNNKKLSSLEEILLSQSEELRLLSTSNQEVWDLSFDRIQELYESESQIKEEIEKLFINNNDIKSKFIEHKDILEEKVNALNNDLIGKISETREEVLTELDTKITDVNSTFESKINNLYSEITNIISEVHSFNEINSSQILSLKDEVNNFVIDTNNKLFEINEEMNLLPEEDPKFHRLFSEVEQLRLDNDTSMYEIKKIYESWILNNKKLSSLEEILLSQSEELKLLSASNEEVWNLSFDRIQELYESESQIKEEIEKIFLDSESIKNKLNLEKDKIKERINNIDTDIKEKISSLELDLTNKINDEIEVMSKSIGNEFNDKIDMLFNQTIELIENVRVANDESNVKFEEINNAFKLDLEEFNRHIMFLEERVNQDLEISNNDLVSKIDEVKELNIFTNNEIEKNKKLWLLNNFKLNSFRDLLNAQSKEISNIDDEIEPSDEMKRKIEDLLEIDENLKLEIDDIVNSNIKIEKNMRSQKNNLMNKINELLEDSKKDISENFDDKLSNVYNQSMEVINIVTETIQENKESIDIVHNLINNNFESANNKIQKLVEDVNKKFDKKDGLVKINELAKNNDDISKEISRIQKDWVINNDKLRSLENMLNEEMKRQKIDVNTLRNKNASLEGTLIDLLELDGSINNEIESIKNKNLILEDNLFTFKENFEQNIKSIIEEIDIKINSMGSEINKDISEKFDVQKIFSEKEIVKAIEEIVYSVISKEIDNLPFKKELLRLTEEDNKIKSEIQILIKKLNNKNIKINQLIFDEIWNCNLKIESIIENVMAISKDNHNINDLRKYIDTSSKEIKRSYSAWVMNNKKIIALEELILKQNELIQYLMDSNKGKEEIDKVNINISDLKSEISSIENNNNIIDERINEIIKKQEISTENLYNEILNIINDIDSNLHKKIEEKLKNIEYPLDGSIRNKEDVKKIILEYSEKIISSELKDFIKMFEENSNELDKSHNAWLKNNQKISEIEDIILEQEKEFKNASNVDLERNKTSLSEDEKDSIEKLILNHKKRLI